jgi:hypothetical protein
MAGALFRGLSLVFRAARAVGHKTAEEQSRNGCKSYLDVFSQPAVVNNDE